ncbi:MAG: hypothetical protein AAF985_00355 [Bacteroidota bacterium]
MKQLTLTLFTIVLSLGLHGQQLFFEGFSGYNRTAYNLSEYNSAQGYVPLGFRIAGGFERIQLGAEYRRQITNPAFTFTNPTNGEDFRREEFVETYYGALLRANISSLPAYRFGLVLKAGAGFYNTTRQLYALPEEIIISDETFEYDRRLGFNAGIGVSAPIYTLLHWEIGYQFNFVDRDEQLTRAIPEYQAYYHSFQMGLSLNLVFGNVAKKCRRVITSSRR